MIFYKASQGTFVRSSIQNLIFRSVEKTSEPKVFENTEELRINV